MTLEQIEALTTQKKALEHLKKLRTICENMLKLGERENIKVSDVHLACHTPIAVAMLNAGIDSCTKEIDEIEAFFNSLEVVQTELPLKAKTKKGGE